MHYNRNVFYFKYFQLLMCSAGDKKSIESIMEARGHSILSTGSLISLDTPVLLSAEPSSAEEKNATAEIKLNTIEIVTETTKRTRERLADIEKKLEESSLRSVFTKATEIKSDSELQSAKPLSTREKISTAEVKLNTRNNILVVPKSTIFSLSSYPSKTSTDALRMPIVVKTSDVVVIFPR